MLLRYVKQTYYVHIDKYVQHFCRYPYFGSLPEALGTWVLLCTVCFWFFWCIFSYSPLSLEFSSVASTRTTWKDSTRIQNDMSSGT